MEKTTQSFFSKLMSFMFIAIGVFLGIYAFFANATSRTVGSIQWDNQNYLNGLFRDQNPTTGDIITALYGSGDEGSIYTENWTGYNSGTCLNSGMSVVYTENLSGGTLSANTIYVLTGTSSITTATTNMAECSAVISNQATGTLFQSTIQLGNGMFNLNNKNNIILDNLEINGTGGGLAPNHTANTEGIKLSNPGYLNTTINNTNIYNTSSAAIFISAGSYGNITNSTFYNNPVGLYIEDGGYIMINNIDMYNNYGDGGMFVELSCDHCSFNNIQAHNNSVGLGIGGGSYTIFNNIQSYNNQDVGISISSSVHTIFHNIASYNNQYGIYQYAAGDITYYDTNTFFNNTAEQIHGTLTTGLVSDYPELGRGGGILSTTGIYSWDMIANPVNTLGNYLLIWTGTLSSLTGSTSSYLSTTTNKISYGSGISTQTQPVLYSGVTITTGGSFNTTNFIGSNTTKITGDLFGLHPYSPTTGIILTGTSLNGGITKYSLFGNFTPFIYNQNINTSTGIFLTTGHNIIITQLYNPSGYFATHFQKNTVLDTTIPLFTGTTMSGSSVISGGYYNTGVYITFADINLSGATLNGSPYTSGAVIITGDTYIFLVEDLAGNSTGMTFTIDTIAPTLTGVISGTYYNTGITITGFDNTIFSGFKLSGTWYPGNTLTITGEGIRTLTGYDYAENTTGVTFTIDKTTPLFTGTTMSAISVISGGYYNTGIYITFDDINLSGATLNSNPYLSGEIIITGGMYTFFVEDTLGNSTGMTFTIDTIAPTLTGVISGTYYNTGITITGFDNTIFSGFKLSGTWYPGDALTVTGEGVRMLTGYDKAGNTTGITFIIDKTTPLFTGTTMSAISVISGGYYNTGIYITFDDINLSGATLNGFPYISGSVIITGNTYIFLVKDLAGNFTGMTFTIDTINPLVTGNIPATGTTIASSSNVVFTRSGTDTNMKEYTLYVTGSEIHTITTGNITHTIALANGNYSRYVIATDKAGNTGTSIPASFHVTVPLNASITLLTGNLQYNGARYTKDYIQIGLQTNKLANYTFTGDIDNAPLTGTIMPGLTTGTSYLTLPDGNKTIYAQISDGTTTTGKSFTLRLDTSAPTLPALISPINGTVVEEAFTLDWSDSVDAGAGTSGYYYSVSSTGIYASVVKSGFTQTSSVTIAHGSLGSNGTYYRSVRPIDRLGNSGTTSMQYFVYSGGILDTTPNAFSFQNITGATPNRTYLSNTITVSGMTPNTPVLASVNRGALYISGHFVGTTGYVQNGWTVNIELISSYEYNKTNSGILNINGVTDKFSVTTRVSENDYDSIETNLSNTEKLMIMAVFKTLRNLYNGDKEVEFFNTFVLVLKNKIDEYRTNDPEYNALTYLYNLIKGYYDGEFSGSTIDGARWIVKGMYTAPNGKKYPITYDSSKQRFTSSNFVVPKYFPTLDTLKYIIDINNPVGSKYSNSKPILARWKNASIDGTRQTSPYTAPNKKTFYFFKTIDGKYSSYTFSSERYFNSLDDTKEFIYNENKKK